MTTPLPHQTIIQKPWGEEIIFTPNTTPYTGKVLKLKKDHRLSLQIHTEKQETITLFSGQATLTTGLNPNALTQIEMKPLCGYTIFAGTIHRIQALKDSILLESSTPEKGTTKRLEDDYKRLDETPEERKKIHAQQQA